MFNLMICVSNKNGDFVKFEKQVSALRSDLNDTIEKFKNFQELAYETMKKTNFCGCCFSQTVYVPEFPAINETRDIRPSMLLQNQEATLAGMIEWAESEAARLESFGAKIVLANFGYQDETRH